MQLAQHCIEVHGRADRVRCSHVGCVNGAPKGSLSRDAVDFSRFLSDPCDANVPKCPECFHDLRPHVLWFDERYDDHADYQINVVYPAAKRAQCVLFVGTSFAVGDTEGVLEHALSRGAFVATIDPSGRSPRSSVRVLAEKAEDALPRLMNMVGAV